MGTLTQKIQCQSRPWVTAPPTSGPLATARPPIPPQMPITVPRRAGGKADVRMVRLTGMTTAAPIPWTARAAISIPADGARAQAADAAVKVASPTAKSRRRPNRSPSAAAGIMPAAKASVKALTVHSSVERRALSSRWIAGSAVTATSASSATMKKATAVMASVQMGPARRVDGRTAMSGSSLQSESGCDSSHPKPPSRADVSS